MERSSSLLTRLARTCGEILCDDCNNDRACAFDEISRLNAKIDAVLALTDMGSPEYASTLGTIIDRAPGWRVAEKIREILNA